MPAGVTGGTERGHAALRPLIDLGVRQFILGFGHVTDPDRVPRLAEDVLAPLRTAA